MDELCAQELVVLEPIDANEGVDLLRVVQGPRADASGDEGRESGGVDGDSSLVQVVEDHEGLGELVPPGESLDVSVDGVRVLAVERQRLRERDGVVLVRKRLLRGRRGMGSAERRRFGAGSGGEGFWRERVKVRGEG